MLDPDACYAALRARDPAADGRFFVGVTTTGIYCRPVCPARTPARGHVTFHPSAAAAQAAGYRACLRCRPETAPNSPAWTGTLATVQRALRLIDEGALAEASVAVLAGRLGMTDRQLRRLFARHLGAGPVAVEATRRLNLAKQLVHDTALPLTDIAFAAGFGSVRRFNEAFRAAFARAPSDLRRSGRGSTDPAAPLRLRLAAPGVRLPLPVALPEGEGTITADRDGRRWLELRGVPLPHLGRAIAAARAAASVSQ